MHAISSYRGNRHTRRQDRLQYTAPQLASAQCKYLPKYFKPMQTMVGAWAATTVGRIDIGNYNESTEGYHVRSLE